MLKVKPNLMSLLKEKGITQLQLSETTGIPQGSLSRFDKNSRHESAHLFTIARALGVGVEDLFTVQEQEEK
ncbi:helix-turn-helix transcriptional regulator [Paenibacillus peoriae]|uniref:Helix-turn-helix transcriptional regulator n=1 Tax=Paenibacillus peoriae TaxID=59893 RepID=A0A7H0Y1T5_9BACL|nr:helix-turn-helix transcriptional regulator [Paenibacillus peoriae]QNR65043.1 helix-turn-helix transcriptional regulator [Paenibacillus peoriae]